MQLTHANSACALVCPSDTWQGPHHGGGVPLFQRARQGALLRRTTPLPNLDGSYRRPPYLATCCAVDCNLACLPPLPACWHARPDVGQSTPLAYNAQLMPTLQDRARRRFRRTCFARNVLCVGVNLLMQPTRILAGAVNRCRGNVAVHEHDEPVPARGCGTGPQGGQYAWQRARNTSTHW